MKFTIKIIRTIIGLPFALLLWPVAIVLSIVGLFLVFLVLVKFVLDGHIDAHSKMRTIELLTFPYQFIKKVWKDEDKIVKE